MAKKTKSTSAPEHLSPQAKAKWARYCDCVDLSTPFAIDVLAQYCEQGVIYDVAACELKAHFAATNKTLLQQTNTMQGEHPAIKTMKDASVQMRKLRESMTMKDDGKDDW